VTDVEHEWVGEEFEDGELGDRRLNNRMVLLAQGVAESPDRSFPKTFEDPADLEGAYRFFNNRKVTPEGILKPHILRTIERSRDDKTVLAIHDSTLMTYRAGGKRTGMSELRKGEQQFLAHVTLAVAGDGSREPLGVIGLSGQKKEKTAGKKQAHRRESREEFASDYDRWLDRIREVEALPFVEGQLLHVADREADDYELLAEILALRGRFVIRSSHNRRLCEGHEKEHLRELLIEAKVVSERRFQISTRSVKNRGPDSLRTHPAREGREAQVEIAVAKATVKRPRCEKTRGLPEGVEINVVHVRELSPPPGEPAVDWLLLTTEPVATSEQAERVVDIYRTRWLIEEYFKALKTGCAYEKRQLASLRALTNALALFAPIAWRHLLIRSQAQQNSQAPATTIFSEDELYVLRAKARRRRLPEDPTVEDAYLSLAGLGGHLKRNGPPGWKSLSDGYDCLMKWMTGFYLAKYGWVM
jgi:hypothetical protein